MSHFYDHLGNPVYEVPMSTKEGMRDTTIRDARKLSLVPSVTTITSILDKGGLLRYFLQHTVKACLSQPPQKESETFEEYVDRLHFKAKEESKQAANKGSYYHNCLEQYFKGKPLDGLEGFNELDQAFIIPIIDAVFELIGHRDARLTHAEPSFAHELGFGGKIDLIANQGQFIIDFKGKSGEDVSKFHTYEEHLMQLAAYRYGMQANTARCVNIYFSTSKPGIIKVHEWEEEDLQRGWEQFKCLLKYWQLSNKIVTEFSIEKENNKT